MIIFYVYDKADFYFLWKISIVFIKIFIIIRICYLFLEINVLKSS